ncbi:MAG TPA: hypothetical protein VL356_06555 [Acidocella sp.]|nr:hypothetical protein [Acidocella sp.]
MTPDGAFIDPPKPTPVSFGTIVARVIAFGVALCIVSVLLWAALFIIPVLILLGVVGYFFARGQMRQMRAPFRRM